MENMITEQKLSELASAAGGSDEEWASLQRSIEENRWLSREWDNIKYNRSFGSNADRVLEILNRHWNLDSGYGEGNIPIRCWKMGNWYKSYSFGQVLDAVNNYIPSSFEEFTRACSH